MSKKEHNESKSNYGAPMASDTRARYVERRMVSEGRDFLAHRAASMSGRALGTLERGSKWRSVADYRARSGRPMLG